MELRAQWILRLQIPVKLEAIFGRVNQIGHIEIHANGVKYIYFLSTHSKPQRNLAAILVTLSMLCESIKYTLWQWAS